MNKVWAVKFFNKR